MPIWSTKNQSDLVWYPAKKQADDTWVVHMNIKNHKFHTGKYTTHVYMYTKNQGVHAISLGQTNVQSETEQLKGQIKNVNAKAGTYDIVVQAKSGAGIKQVSVPIWSKANQSDLIWYPAKKQADGSYVVHMNIKNHKYHTGNYTTHVYATKNNGTEMAINLGQTNIQGIKDQLSAAIKNVNSQAGSYDVVVKASAPSGVKSVRVPIWTNARDIKWYEAKRQADGTWLVHMDIKNHGNHVGKYTTHVYMTANDGRETAINVGQTELKGQPLSLSAEIKNVNSQAGSYDVVVKASAPSGVKSVRVPIWTNARDIKWYEAKRQADGTWLVHMDIKNHSNHLGKYTTHVYMTAIDGRETAINAGQTEIKGQLPTDNTGTQQPVKPSNPDKEQPTQPTLKQATFELDNIQVPWSRTDRVIDESYLKQAFKGGTDEYGQPLSIDKLKITNSTESRTIKGGTDYPVQIEVSYQAKNGIVKRYASVSVIAPVNTIEGVRKEMLKLVNDLRASVGVQPVRYDELLNKGSDIRVQELKNKFSHIRPDGRQSYTVLSDLIGEDKYFESYTLANENAKTFYGIGDDEMLANIIFTGWKNSPGHYSTMISPLYTRFGFSFLESDGHQIGTAQQFFDYNLEDKLG